MIRIDKYLVEMGVASRSQIKDMAKKGRIKVNDTLIKKTDLKIDEDVDRIYVDGSLIEYKKVEYYMLNKPAGVITATEDKHTKTVLDLITVLSRTDLFPVGRLDKDTEGLLIITNDGDLAHRLLSPKSHVDKVYYAKIDGIVTSSHIIQFREGITLLDGTKVMPGELKILSTDIDKNVSEIELTIHEGKFHQVKRMFEAIGTKVTYLKRLSMGPIILDENLKPGDFRILNELEISKLMKLKNIEQ